MLGHTDPATTMRYYAHMAHVLAEQGNAGSTALDRAFGG
jgi:hypothetical protein